MRQLVKAAAIVAGMVVFGVPGFAQCRIAVVDMQDAVTGSNEGKVKAANFDTKVADWTAKLDKIKADIDVAQNKLKTQSTVASQTVINDLNKTIKDKQTELSRTTEDAQKDVDEFRDQLLTPVMKTAEEIMNALAAEKNYSLVYDLSAQNSPIVYSSKDCDITEEVKKRMNAKSGVAAPPASTAAPARGTTPAAGAAAGRGATTPGATTPAPAAGRGATAPAAGTATPPRGGTTPAATPPTAPK
ncbi:MAG TPA: OmpH family outer membrane protein [Terriglobia bacterium]|nr:OmpH family outer membrane protein [Terriglobia bacterium]